MTNNPMPSDRFRDVNYNFVEKAKDYHSTLFICSRFFFLPVTLVIVCTSTGRRSTSYEVFDQYGESMGECDFNASFMCVTPQRFNYSLVEDLNILLEEFGFSLDKQAFFEISKLAVSKCESRYGNSIEGGDCVITLTGAKHEQQPSKSNCRCTK